ncbi:hypothetical protein EUGRSUZ_A00273 [Eucalyptus grandis]|uniref:Uncharacterized protein n=2 Tax=Eucalyptus grandis TaxID=71139 RepID=A0ACC3LZ92_EUCGR|nr:hypothetical protein EUGRSUZ_A00273 [Eucalyptus grandis]
MLSQMDPALVTYCEKIAAQGGPINLPDDLAGSTFPSTPVVHLGTGTRASARLRNVQPDLNLDQTYVALKRPKKNVDGQHGEEEKFRIQDSGPSKSSHDLELNDVAPERPEPSPADVSTAEPPEAATECGDDGGRSNDALMLDSDVSDQVASVKKLFIDRTDNYVIPQLERLYTRIIKGVFETRKGVGGNLRHSILSFLLKFAENEANFSS